MKHVDKVRLSVAGAAGTLAGLCIGAGLTLEAAASNDAVRYGLYRLILLDLQEYLNTWVLTGLGLMLGGALLCGLLVGLAGRFLPGRPVLCAWLGAGLTLLVGVGSVAAFVHAHRGLPWIAGLLLGAFVCGWLFAAQPAKHLGRLAQKTALVIVAALLLLNLGLLADRHGSPPAGPNIVLIVVDCLRPDHMGRSGYARNTTPALDELARRSVVFERAYANAPWTKPSVATMFTGLYPNAHGATSGHGLLPEKALTLAEILRSSGYRTLFFNSGNEFIERAHGFGQGFDTYVYHPAGHTNAGVITQNFISHVSALGRQRFFAYLHYMDAHTPYASHEASCLFTAHRIEGLEPGNRQGRFKYLRLMTTQGQLDKAGQEYIAALYDAQLRLIDRQIQRVVQALQSTGVLQNTMLIIASDHGEEFWDHGNFEHGHTLYKELLHVPLIVSGTGLAPAEVSVPVRLIDMAPTVLGLARVAAPAAMVLQGRSLLPLLQGYDQAQGLPVFATGTLYGPEKYCLIREDHKLIVNTDQKQSKWNLIGYRFEGPLEYYDLRSDPREQSPAPLPANQLALQAELDEFINELPLFEGRQLAGHLKKDIRDKLEALGYVQ